MKTVRAGKRIVHSWQVVGLFALAWALVTFVAACEGEDIVGEGGGGGEYAPETGGGPEVWLDWPVERDEPYPLNEVIEIQSHSHDPGGARLSAVHLRIMGPDGGGVAYEDTMVSDGYVAHVVQEWKPKEPGEYVVEVQSIRSDNVESEPDIARITVMGEDVVIEFTSDKMTVKYGECTMLHWTVKNAREGSVHLNGEPVPEEGEREVCPTDPTSSYRIVAESMMSEPASKELTLTVPPTPKPVGAPDIMFEADEGGYQKFGDCITLLWKVTGSVQAVQLDGEKVGLEGESERCPTEPTNTYRLEVTLMSGEVVERLITFNVPPTPTPIPAAPTIKFSADQTALPAPGSCTTLRWSVQNAHTVLLDGESVPASGDRRVCPEFTSNSYIIVAIGDGGRAEKTVIITVTPLPTGTPTPTPTTYVPPLPAEISFWADSESIRAGDCTHIRWHVANVSAYWVDGEGKTGSDGSKKVCPCEDKTYTLRVRKTDGSEQSFHVTVHVSGSCYTPTEEPTEYYYPTTEVD